MDDQERAEEKCGLLTDYQVTWACGGWGWWWWKWLPKFFHSILMKFRILSLLFKALHIRCQLPFLASPFNEPSVPPSYVHLQTIVWRPLLPLCPLYGFPATSDAAVSICYISSCTSWDTLAPSLSSPSSRLELLHISLTFVELFWGFESCLALMKGDDGTASLCTKNERVLKM